MIKLLPEVCKIQYGFAFNSKKFSTDKGIPLVRIRDVVRGYSETYTTEECGKEYSVDNGDMLVGMDGEFNVARWNGGKAWLNQRVCKLIPNEEIDAGYLFYFMPSALKAIEAKTSFVTVKHLSAKELNKIQVPVPMIQEQHKIATVLDKVTSLIIARKKQLAKLDELVKARFVEMFGDPVANDKGWIRMPIEETCRTIVDCPHSTPSYTTEDTGYMCIRTSIVKKNMILWDEIEYIPEDEFVKRIQRKKPEVGDIVYTREGAILGIAAIIDRECNVALGQRSMLLSPDRDKCISEFLCIAMNCDSFLDNALKGVAGSASPHINVGDIKAFKMIMPPVDLQKQFAVFVNQVDQSKAVVQKALDKAQLLFDSLMQEYFG